MKRGVSIMIAYVIDNIEAVGRQPFYFRTTDSAFFQSQNHFGGNGE